MYNFIDKINNNIWIIAFIFIFFLNIISVQPSGDDLVYGSDRIWPQQLSFIEAVIRRYMTWSPRIFSEWLTYFFTHHNILLFKILNSIVCTLFIYFIYKLSAFYIKDFSLNSKLLCIFFTCLYPWENMRSAGDITTLIFYLWPFMALLYVIYILIKYNNKIRISIKEYIIYSIMLIFLVNIEQTVTYAVLFSLIFMIYNIKNKIKNILNITTLIISIMGMIFLLTAPGEHNRFIIEMIWYPTYEMLSFMDKINLGLTSTMYHFIASSEAIVLYLFFFIGLFIMVWNKYTNKCYCILMAFNFIWIVIGMKLEINDSIIIGMENFKMLDAMNLIMFSGYWPTLISMLLLLWPCIGLYLIYNEDSKKCFMIIFIYLFSFFNRFILGFSPTVFASSTRTYLPVFVMLIFINSIMYIKIFQDNKKYKENNKICC